MKKLLVGTVYWPSHANRISGIFVSQQVKAFEECYDKIQVLVVGVAFKKKVNYLSVSDLGLNPEKVSLKIVYCLKLPEQEFNNPWIIKLNNSLFGLSLRYQTYNLVRENITSDVILHGLRYLGLSYHTWSRKILNKAVVVYHGIDPYITNRNRSALFDIYSKVEGEYKAFVIVGTMLRKDVIKFVSDPDKIKFIANGANVFSKLECRHRDDNNIKILSVSNLVQLKGIDLNIRALAKIKKNYPDINWKYKIVGDGDELEYLRKLVTSLKLDNEIEFSGRLSHSNTLCEMEKSDIFVLPSWAEAFGIVYLEAMSRYNLVIGCWDNGAEDIIRNGYDGVLVEPKNVTDLYDKLSYIMNNKNIISEYASAAMISSRNFSWKKNTEKYIDLFN